MAMRGLLTAAALAALLVPGLAGSYGNGFCPESRHIATYGHEYSCIWPVPAERDIFVY